MNDQTIEDYYKARYDDLIHGTIEEIIVDIEDREAYVGLLVRKGNKTFVVWALSDAEGNGAGYLDINLVEVES